MHVTPGLVKLLLTIVDTFSSSSAGEKEISLEWTGTLLAINTCITTNSKRRKLPRCCGRTSSCGSW
jgi:hypothetical protein